MILILAQGKQSRIGLNYPKCLISVGGQTLLRRTIVLSGPQDYAIIGWPTLDELGYGYKLHSLVNPGHCILDGLSYTQSLWKANKRLTILLGDVFYSKKDLMDLLSSEDPVRFLVSHDLSTSGGEVFGATFAPGVLYEVSQALYSAPCRAPGLIDYQGGHFRNLLWSLQTSRGNPDPRIDLSPELVLISDEWTMDFDVPEHLNEIPRLERYLSSSVPGQGT